MAFYVYAVACNRKERIQDLTMAELTRKNAREEAFRLLFETEFRTEADAEAIYALAGEHRELPENAYIRKVYFGVREHLKEIDEKITRHSDGWKAARITPVSRSAMRLCIYEMKYMESNKGASFHPCSDKIKLWFLKWSSVLETKIEKTMRFHNSSKSLFG